MRCGNPMTREKQQPAAGPAAAPASGPIDAPVADRHVSPYFMMGLIVLLVFLLGWGFSTILQARAAPQETLQATNRVQPGLVATAEQPPGMPQAVHDWLEHLRRIEEQKNRLTAEQVSSLKMFGAKFQALGPAAGLLTPGGDDEDHTNPSQPIVQMTTDMVGPWNKLIKDYQSVPPPPECQKLADEYFAGLNEIPAEMSDVQKLLQNMTQQMSSDNPQSGETDANKEALKQAQDMQGKSSEDIDSHFTNSDEMLGQVCDQYHTRKWFAITSDLGGGLLNTPF